MNILILGGTTFFGKELVQKFISEGINVTVATRGNKKPFNSPYVQYQTIDRTKTASMKEIGKQRWDVVYDQICMNENDAEIAVYCFKDVGRYIFTSTISVYELGSNLKEENFNTDDYDTSRSEMKLNYTENKRRAEKFLADNDEFPVISVRLPIVLGLDDPTRRLYWHFERIKQKESIFFSNLKAKMSFITQEDAANFLFMMRKPGFIGPINVHTDALNIEDIVEILEDKTKMSVKMASVKTSDNQSPYGIEKSWFMSIKLAESLGYKSNYNLKNYLQKLVATFK